MKEIKAIITDLDGVLRIFPESRNAEFEKKYSLPANSLMTCAFGNKDLDLVVRGKITDEKWRSNIAKRLLEIAPNVDSKKIILEWSNFEGQLDRRVLDLYKKMKRERPFVLMTNATDKLDQDLNKLGIRQEFDLIINASEVGYAKPDQEIFHYALSKLSLKSSEIAFIDDSKKIIEQAEKMGFCAHHYQSYDEFKVFCESNLRYI